MTEADRRAAARAVAGALALRARAIGAGGRPVDLWAPTLSPDYIREVAARVGRGEAEALWADEAQPTQGLLIYAPSPWETDFFGYGCARLAGPYLAENDQRRRETRVRRLAALAAGRARERGDRLVTLKTGSDPAALRGFLAEGFVLAEIGAALAYDLPPPPAAPAAGPPKGFAWLERRQAAEQAAGVMDFMGDFFYDGHLRHDPDPGPEAARRLWRQVALDDLAGAAGEAVVLWDRAQDRPAGLATARLTGETAGLSILALAEPYRGRGLGRPLLSEMIRRLIGRAAGLKVETAAYNLPALALYQALGFQPRAPLVALHLHSERSV
ncbi:MAG: GNAT family N-acetyltransferase [Candidatus Adiutrix sp.]|nr:GNAT family N-acetyltransferase [Candidatus Adiutrix sp.]